MFIEFLNLYGLKIICALFMAFMGWLGLVTKRTAVKYLDTDEKRTVAKTAMLAVEQLYKDIHGPEKMQHALLIAKGMLEERGIKATVDEMKMLIEAALGEFNANFVTLEPVEVGKLYEGAQQGSETE